VQKSIYSLFAGVKKSQYLFPDLTFKN